MAGEKGKSTLKNAHKHLKNNQILKLDMSNFYPNCTREYIYSFFNKKMQCSPDVSELLCNLLLYNNGLCQGSSPSMVLSFFAYQDMFFEINKIVSERGLIMTTWVDDITISGPDNFNNKKITSLISKVVHAYGHKIKNNKVNFSRKNSAKRVTGIIIDKQKKLKVPNRIRSEIIQLFKIFKINPTKEMKSKLIGKINFAQSIEKNVFEELKNQINSINITN